MPKYLYGAAVQGIQDFIFQTNRLKEIMGASELVEQICTERFAKTLYGNPDKMLLEKDPNAILNAAGNIKYIFDNEEDCRRVARIFPKSIMEYAPGITISQSVVRIEEGQEFGEAVQILEKNLRTQRNRQIRDTNLGLMGILRNRQTGMPASHKKPMGKETGYLDSATYHKLFDEKGNPKYTLEILCKKAFGPNIPLDRNKFPNYVEDMTGSNDWIAIIHADGNGLGQIVREIGADKDTFREFSKKLDKATTEAARRAFMETVYRSHKEGSMIPVRPIVLSGDDHTVICRADIAIPYAEAFLKYFEEETAKELGTILSGQKADGRKPIFSDGSLKLTACAGIAFVKSSFPFHFGYRLAESLCDRAKKDTKVLYKAKEGNLPASCLMFHKVQDSFVTDFSDISRRELRPQKDISFEFGPYYLDSPKSGRWTIKNLLNQSNNFQTKDGNAVKSGLRNWITLLHENPSMAQQKIIRMIDIIQMEISSVKNSTRLKELTRLRELLESVASKDGSNVRRDVEGIYAYPVYDLLAVNTINTQKTKTR